MTEKITVFRLSDKGKAALKGTEPLTSGQQLIMEVMKQCGRLTRDNCLAMCTQLTLHYGSKEAALEAVRNGEVTFNQEN
jgi:hypothetical protein